MTEMCRVIHEDGSRCGNKADVIVWGRLFSPDALGPRCWNHAEIQVGFRNAHDRQFAIYRIPLPTAAQNAEDA